MFIDTHCHLDDEKFVDVDKVVNAYLSCGVDTVINMGCDINSSKLSRDLSHKYQSVFYGVGIHPEYADKLVLDDIETLIKLADDNKCVAIGEIGLDYHYGEENKEKQKECFVSQIELASILSLPISVHSRDATKDTLDIIKSEKEKLKNGFILHCFSGSVEIAREYLNLGGYLGFGGTLTFKNARNLIDVTNFVPFDRILTETDSPYLSPEPKRGTINSPENIPIITKKIAEIKGNSIEEMARIIKNNARAVFKKLS